MKKKNPAPRITDAMLDRRVTLLNEVLGRPTEPWTRKKGKTNQWEMKANIGNLHISGAYGGVSLHEMMNEGGGINDISQIGYVPKRELYNFINGMLAAAEFRKKNPITEGQLESFVYELDGSGRDELKGALAIAIIESKDMRISSAKRKIYKDLAKLLRKEIKKFSPSRGDYKGNPKRKKTMAKKKRSAKQLANDKRLGRMAKARAKKKRGKKRRGSLAISSIRKARKRNPKRTTRAKSHLQIVFKCKGKAVYFLTLRAAKLGWTLTKGDAIFFSTKAQARHTAQNVTVPRDWSLAIAPSNLPAAGLAADCKRQVEGKN